MSYYFRLSLYLSLYIRSNTSIVFISGKVMTSGGNDVISRCAEAGLDSPTKRFYIMTTLDDDVIDVADCGQQQTIVDHFCASVYHCDIHEDRTAAAADDDDDECEDEQKRLRREGRCHEEVQNDNEVESDDDDDDDDDDNDSHSVVGFNQYVFSEISDRNVLLQYQSDNLELARKSLPEIPQQKSRTPRLRPRPNQMSGSTDIADHVQNMTQDCLRVCNISGMQTKLQLDPKASENVEKNQNRTKNQSATLQISDDSETGNRISFDRKLIDDIDAAMAENGCKTLCFRTVERKGSVNGEDLPQCSAHSDHVISDSQSHSCHLEASGKKSRRKTGKQQSRSSVISKRRQKLEETSKGVFLYRVFLLCCSHTIYRVAQKSKPLPIFQKIVLKIANEIRFLLKVKV